MSSLGTKKLFVWKSTGGQCQQLIPVEHAEQEDGRKQALFDFDDTLVKVFKNELLPNVKDTLQRMQDDGQTVVIISNQLGITKMKTTQEEVQTRFENVILEINIPISVIYAYGNDNQRKPHTMMQRCLKTVFKINEKTEIFQCGDAAGRPKTNVRKRDFSNSDLLFAQNCGLTFQPPESVIGRYPSFGPTMTATPNTFEMPKKVEIGDIEKGFDFNKPMVIMMVGPQGSGKSSFKKQVDELMRERDLKEFVLISQDVQKTKKSAINLMKKEIKKKSSLQIDNTNSTVNNRREQMSLIPDEYQRVCIWFDIPKSLSKHMTDVRVEFDNGKHIPMVAIHKQQKGFEKPMEREGFEKIIRFENVVEKGDVEGEQFRKVFRMRFD